MHLYDCRMGKFIPEATSGEIASILQKRFSDRLEMKPSPEEVKSWKNSLGGFAEAVATKGMDDAWIILEYQLPLASLRIDAMIVGTNKDKKGNAVLAEFKQWDRCKPTTIEDLVDIGGRNLLHPSAQVRNYRQYLEDAHSGFVDGGIQLSSCAFLHTAKSVKDSGFFDKGYRALLEDSPLFCIENVDSLSKFIGERTRFGSDSVLVDSIVQGAYRPSKKLLDNVASSINGHEPWKLLDEQQLVFSQIMADIQEAKHKNEKRVIVVSGGPGTGKSVIALQVVGAAAREGYSVVHATGSKAFTLNMRGIVGRRETFVYFNNFTKTPPNSIDLIVCDEAHRLRVSSADRFRKGTGRPQVGEIIDTARVSVFLLDSQQTVRGNEVGSVNLITDYAESKKIQIRPYDLNIQFRTAGSESYVNWVNHVLGLSPNRSMRWKTQNEYEVKVFERVEELELALQNKVMHGSTARMVAGFCWDWSDPKPNDSLVPDVRIGSWARPWNKKPRDMWKNKGSAELPAKHPYTIWAAKPEGFNQVGCIYSAQGFEFDYMGVIFGGDLRWDSKMSAWVADLTQSRDPGFKMGLRGDDQLALEKLKHVYRVLSTRGMKGTYFYFLDEETRRRFEQLGA